MSSTPLFVEGLALLAESARRAEETIENTLDAVHKLLLEHYHLFEDRVVSLDDETSERQVVTSMWRVECGARPVFFFNDEGLYESMGLRAGRPVEDADGLTRIEQERGGIPVVRKLGKELFVRKSLGGWIGSIEAFS